ncbi:MAG: STAS domain-containing protein [Gammaproteobacteria bacterium]|jgi:phospholipid transport system transporter-binding protein
MPATLQSAGDAQLSLAGTLNFDSVPGLYRQLAPHLKQDGALSIDLGSVEHFNSAGLALLLQWLEDARRRNVELTFLNLPAAHGELASLYNLSGLFGEDQQRKT